MWRAFFLALGISLVIIGAQCLVVERVVLARGKHATTAMIDDGGYFQSQSPTTAIAERYSGTGKHVVPPDWAPWSLMAAGAVVMLYSFTIPRRVAS